MHEIKKGIKKLFLFFKSILNFLLFFPLIYNRVSSSALLMLWIEPSLNISSSFPCCIWLTKLSHFWKYFRDLGAGMSRKIVRTSLEDWFTNRKNGKITKKENISTATEIIKRFLKMSFLFLVHSLSSIT